MSETSHTYDRDYTLMCLYVDLNTFCSLWSKTKNVPDRNANKVHLKQMTNPIMLWEGATSEEFNIYILNLIYTIITTALIINEAGTNFPDHS